MRVKKRPVAPVIAAGVLASWLCGAAAADIRPHPGMLRYPDVCATHIVFVYANDLWIVPREGGVATPLASPPGGELYPKFSRDGERIAFVGNYEGNRDLYVTPRAGGSPLRLTHHPASENLCDWTPGGGLCFASNGLAGLARQAQLFTVSSSGGLPQRLPVPYGANGAISPDGRWLAYTPHSIDNRTWKRYRGGMATDIWLFDLQDLASKKITDWEGTDTLPMWHEKTIYYLSDAGPEHRLNIWSYDTATGSRQQVTQFKDFDVKWPSMGPGPSDRGEIVFQNGSDLFLFDLRTGAARVVEVTIPGDRPRIRPRRVDASKFTNSWRISPTGKRAVVEARGDVWTLPAEHGSPRNLTRSGGTAERDPAWSPDGRWIAYFSDALGEYELYITQSDGKGETRQLTRGGTTFYEAPAWSPDSKRIAYTDKAAQLHVLTVETAESQVIDKDPWGQSPRPSWSHDSRWLAYARTLDERPIAAVWLYDLENQQRHQATGGVFEDAGPVFDRKGDWLFLASGRRFKPTYSDIDTTFIYDNSQVLLAVPLRKDVKLPWLPKSDEESWSKDKKDDEAQKKDEAPDAEKKDEPAAEEKPQEKEPAAAEPPAPADDGVSGTWEGTLSGGEIPPGVTFTMTLWLQAGGAVKGSISTPMGDATLEATYDRATGEMTGTVTTAQGQVGQLRARISGTSLTGSVDMAGMTVALSGTRTAAAAPEKDDTAKPEKAAEAKPREKVEIDLEGFERRAIELPVPAGDFGRLAVNDGNQLIYVRARPEGASEIMLFDLADEKKEEKSVAKGAGDFDISSDGKKLLVLREGSGAIQGPSAGATGKPVVTDGMIVAVDPPQEWKQLFLEAWRLQRDFFYVANMHGVDWPAVRERYAKMLADCATREDVSYVIREMISELNIGHTYYFGGDEENEPSVTVGMLGVDWELDGGAYRIKGICQGAPWDADARNPLAGVDVKAGDYLLAVNGVPVDTAMDPWAAFVGLAGKTTTLTVSDKPVFDETAREALVKPLSGEGDLRYREWIEHNRAYVAEKTGGNVGYIYVPDTGINGQNNLVRQYFGQIDRKALIIDERWNGGGQIPTRFIEMLNRPVTNYWARRDARDMPWPPDAHHGPKCMLINGLAGSGGDMFPWLFRHAGLGRLIGTRTWGGLVGISGNPGLIDGGVVTVPTFGFYETDGTWGVEGHGVDPDIQVIDDPARMCHGEDPQLDAAIALMLDEVQRNPYVPPLRPAPPDRSGMGILPTDR